MFGTGRMKANHGYDVLLNASLSHDPSLIAFCIQPPITVHNPEFMGRDITLNFSNDFGTYGAIKRPEIDAIDGLDEWRQIKDVVHPVFQDCLQTFLGHTSLRIHVVRGSGAEM